MKITRKYRGKAATMLFFSLGSFLFPAAALSTEDGFHLWGWNDGVKLLQATSPHSLSCQQVVPTDDGGAFAVYLYADDLTPTYRYYDAHIEAKRLGADGGVLWTTWASQNLKAKSRSPVATPDGSGGAVVAWVEGPLDLPANPSDPFSDSTTGFEIYVQRFNVDGIKQWASDVRVSSPYVNDTMLSQTLKICPDDIGGAYVGFGTRLVQVNSSGVVMAPGIDGIELIPGGTGSYKMISDGKWSIYWNGSQWVTVPSGVYAAWADSSGRVYAQWVNENIQWGAGGKQLDDHDHIGGYDLALDDSKDLLVCWAGSDGLTPWAQVRAQKLDSAGTPQWSAAGVVIVDSNTVGGSWPQGGAQVAITHDGAGGAIVAWSDSRQLPTGDVDLYAQRIDAGGSKQWNDVLLPPYTVGQTAPGPQGVPKIVPDGVGGALVVYQDLGGWSWDISATRLGNNGFRLWSQWVKFDGSSFSDPGLAQKSPVISIDNYGPDPQGVLIVWEERQSPYDRLFAQKVAVNETPPPNDICTDATNIGSGPQVGAVTWATNDGVAGCGGAAGNADVWYKFTATADGTLNVNTCGTNDIGGADNGMDTVLSIHTGCPGSGSNQLACNDDWVTGGVPAGACSGIDAGGNTRDSAVSVGLSKNQTVYIRVAPYQASDPGQFRLNLEFLVQTSFRGDFDKDADVDGKDLATLAAGYPSNPELDLNEDGRVNDLDVAWMAEEYGRVAERDGAE